MPAQSTRAHNEVTCNTPFRLSVVAVMCVLVVSAFLLLAHRVSMLCELGFDSSTTASLSDCSYIVTT
jgi:hypothetical protein